MKDKKITFKYFSIAEYEKEEAYLRKCISKAGNW